MASYQQPQSFAQKLLVTEGGMVRLITANEKGKPAWFFVELNPAVYADYKRALRQDKMNIKDYGQILESGWGEMPPEEVTERMKDEYGVIC